MNDWDTQYLVLHVHQMQLLNAAKLDAIQKMQLQKELKYTVDTDGVK